VYENKLIYGKNPLERIVSIEISDDTATVFRELEDGSLDIQKHPNRFWILATKPFGPGWVKLEGEQDFKFGKQFKDYKEWAEAKKSYPYQETYTISNVVEQFMVKDGFTYYKGCRHNEVSILSFDIETTGLDQNDESKIILISNTFRRLGKIERKLFSYEDYENCAQMIDDWSQWVRDMDPSILCGHNIYAYDLPYLQFCYNKYKEGNIKLGRLDKGIYFNKYESKYRIDGSRDLHYHKCQVYGRELVDTMFLAYKYDAVEKKYESYGLKSIIKVEGLEKQGRTFYDASTIRINYTNPDELVKIKQYAEEDGDDALALYDLMVAPTFYLTQSIPKPFQLVVESATGSQINSLLVRAYLQDKHSVAKADNLDEEKVEGGISFAVPGIYNNVFKIDIKSCYPSQILRFKLYEERKDPKAYYYQLVEHFTLQRFEYKKQMVATGDNYWKNLDAMAKIFINSSYGVANTSGLNYNSAAIARKITLESRAIIDMALRWASGFGYNHWATRFYDAVGEKEADRVYLSLPDEAIPTKYNHSYTIAPSDTDSISFCKSDGSPFSKEEIKTLLNEINEQSPDKVLWEDDGVYKTIIALKAKNYVLYNPEAKKEKDRLKIKGSALKGSTRPEAVKELIKRFIETMAYTENRDEMLDNLQRMYETYVYEAMNVKEIKRWSARKTLSSTMQKSERANETKVIDAIKGTDYREGDRFFVFKMPDESLRLAEHFDGTYDKSHLLKNLFNTVEIFDTVLPVKEMFPNYSLKKNFKILLDKYPEVKVS
jgi:DNA polymerase elongation subunit (family B)